MTTRLGWCCTRVLPQVSLTPLQRLGLTKSTLCIDDLFWLLLLLQQLKPKMESNAASSHCQPATGFRNNNSGCEVFQGGETEKGQSMTHGSCIRSGWNSLLVGTSLVFLAKELLLLANACRFAPKQPGNHSKRRTGSTTGIGARSPAKQ